MNPCEYTSSIKSFPVVFKCEKKDARCGYHKRGQRYDFSGLTSGSLCPEAYHNLYYLTLGILFKSKFKDKELIVKCPGAKNYVVFKVGSDKLNFRFKVLNIVKWIFFRFYPGQIYAGRLFWEVVKTVGECSQHHVVGDRFYVNKGSFQLTPDLLFSLGEPSGLCPAVFDNFFPYLYSWYVEKGFPYSNGSCDLIQCPDHKANITFKIEKDSR